MNRMLPRADSDPVMLIRIPRLFSPTMSDLALYEATRRVWKVGSRRERPRYALAFHGAVVQEVYEITFWQPAGTTPYQTRTADDVDRPGRWEFVGMKAPEEVRARYVGKSVAEHLPPGAQNPIAYVGVPGK